METQKQTASIETRLRPTALVQRYSTTVFRVAYAALRWRGEAEDVMQEVFLRLLRAQPSFNDDEHAKAWLLRVTMNCCASRRTSAWWRQVDSLDELQEQAGEFVQTSSDEPDVGAAVEAREQRASVLAAVRRLPEKQRVCIHLFYFEEQSIQEISATTGWLNSTVKSHLRRGRATLKAALAEEDYDYEV